MLGVDGCPGGWVAVALSADAGAGTGSLPRVHTAPTLAAVVALASADGSLGVVAVDIPIGLADRGARQADRLAVALLGTRRASLFATPVRAALVEPEYAAAVAVNRGLAGSGFSRQAFGLRSKVLEVDALLRDPVAPWAGPPVVEVHPELSFATMAGAPLRHGKKTWAGAVERRQRLAEHGIVLGSGLGPDPGRAGVDDVLDAAAAAWTARRHLAGTAESLPDPPERFDDGLPCAIWR